MVRMNNIITEKSDGVTGAAGRCKFTVGVNDQDDNEENRELGRNDLGNELWGHLFSHYRYRKLIQQESSTLW